MCHYLEVMGYGLMVMWQEGYESNPVTGNTQLKTLIPIQRFLFEDINKAKQKCSHENKHFN